MMSMVGINEDEDGEGDDGTSDGHVREPERGEPFQIGESQAAADDAGGRFDVGVVERCAAAFAALEAALAAFFVAAFAAAVFFFRAPAGFLRTISSSWSFSSSDSSSSFHLARSLPWFLPCSIFCAWLVPVRLLSFVLLTYFWRGLGNYFGNFGGCRRYRRCQVGGHVGYRR